MQCFDVIFGNVAPSQSRIESETYLEILLVRHVVTYQQLFRRWFEHVSTHSKKASSNEKDILSSRSK